MYSTMSIIWPGWVKKAVTEVRTKLKDEWFLLLASIFTCLLFRTTAFCCSLDALTAYWMQHNKS
jgi:hypothetical protein